MSFSKSVLAFLVLFFGVGSVIVLRASAQTYTVLYRFKGGEDGALPFAGLIQDSAGNLYGTTAGSVTGTTMGSVFELSAGDKFKLLHNFGTGGAGGAAPYAGLVQGPGGSLFGDTFDGGSFGLGTVFKVDPSGNFSVLYSFAGDGDGAEPNATMTIDPEGNLYGTTTYGGSRDCSPNGGQKCGTIFKLASTGTEKVLHSFFSYLTLGDLPYAAVLRDASGNLYGTTSSGGPAGNGTVFKRDTSGNLTILHAFQSQSDGANPRSALIQDSAGNFYGTTISGSSPTDNGGTVFKMDSEGNETVLYEFSYPTGIHPSGLINDNAGNFYGTASQGGVQTPNCPNGCGVVFKLDPSGNQTVLYTFGGGSDGGSPLGGVIMDAAGNLYGTATQGGISNKACPTGCGVVFKITP